MAFLGMEYILWPKNLASFQVGVSFLAGLGFAILLIPVNRWLAEKIQKLSKDMMEQKDNRVKVPDLFLEHNSCEHRQLKVFVVTKSDNFPFGRWWMKSYRELGW